MALDRLFSRLSLQSRAVCRECRRSIVSTRPSREQQPMRTAFADLLQNDRAAGSSATSTASPSSSSPQPTTTDSALARQMLASVSSRDAARQAAKEQDQERQGRRRDLERALYRRWAPGDVYAPHDLSPAEMSKWRRTGTNQNNKYDVIDQLRINPLDHYKNFTMMSEYVSEMGRIKPRRETGLRAVNQRRMSKAIRRAIGIGLIPSVHHHPEILKRQKDSKFR